MKKIILLIQLKTAAVLIKQTIVYTLVKCRASAFTGLLILKMAKNVPKNLIIEKISESSEMLETDFLTET